MSDAAPITIAMDGPPVPKARPKFGRGHTYTPQATRRFQTDFGWTAKRAMIGRKPLAGAIKITALFELPIPRSWPERARAAAITGVILPTGRPDLDNYVKSAIDACNGIVFSDDAVICEISAKKIYGAAPKTILTIFPAPSAPAINLQTKESENETG